MAVTVSALRRWSLKILVCGIIATAASLTGTLSQLVKADTVIDTTVTPDFQTGIAISNDGSLIAFAEQDTYKVHFLDSDLNLLRSTVTLTDPNAIIIDSTKTFAYVIAVNGQRIYSIDIGNANVVTTGTTNWNGACIAALPGGTHVLTCEGTSLVKRAVADLQAGTSTHSTLAFSSVIFQAIPNSDGSRIYVAESSGHITVVNSNLNIVTTFSSPNGFNPLISLSPDGSLLAVASYNLSTTKILNASTGVTLATLPFVATKFSPNGRLLYGISGTQVGAWEGRDTVQTYRVGTWELVKSRSETGFGQGVFDPTSSWFYSISRSPDAINKVAISPDLVLEASSPTSSTGSISFVLDSSSDIDCSTLSATIGVDFVATGIDSIDRIDQTTSRRCTVFATSSARPGLGAVTSRVTAANTFSVAGRSGLLTDMFGIAAQGSTVVTLQALPTTTTTTTTTTTVVGNVSNVVASTSTTIASGEKVSGSAMPVTGSSTSSFLLWSGLLLLAGVVLQTRVRYLTQTAPR